MHNVPSIPQLDDDASTFRPPPSYRASLRPARASPSPLHTLPPNTRSTSATQQHSSQSRSAPIQHVYSLFDSRNVPWATLTLLSNVGSPRFLPAYFEGQAIHGTLELNLRKPETILGIDVTVSGTIMAANAPDPRVFWELTRVLWSTDMGDPRSTTQSQSQSSISASESISRDKGKGKGSTFKLMGPYSWSFCIPLPSTCAVTLNTKEAPVTLPLPPSFSEKGASQFINYEITARIRRGPLRIDSKLGTHFGFAPRTRPPAPSPLRQLAYQENKPLVGPNEDPDGWTVLPSIIVRGKLFGVRMVEAACTLTYSRGHPLPLMLTVSCADAQALDLVFAPQNISVHLIRQVCYDTGPGSGFGSPSPSEFSRGRKGWGSGLDSSPADSSLFVTASSPPTSTAHFNRYTFLPRAASASSHLADGDGEASLASASVPVPGAGSASGSGLVGAGVASDAHASLAGIRRRRPSLYRQPSSSSISATFSNVLSRTSSTLSSLSFGTSKSERKSKTTRRETTENEKAKAKGKEKVVPPKIGPKLALHGARTPVTSAVWWSREQQQIQSDVVGNISSGRNRRETSRTRRTTMMTITTAAASVNDDHNYDRERHFEGEILLPKDLVPSFEFGGFSVKYALALLSFQAPGFELTPRPSQPEYASARKSPLPPYPPASLPSSPHAQSFSSSSSFTAPNVSSGDELGLGVGPLVLTHEPLLLSPISITTLPFLPSSTSTSSRASPTTSPASLEFITPSSSIPISTSIPSPTPTPSAAYTPTPRSRAPPDVDAQAHRAAHAERVKKPVIWGLFNQFETGGLATVSGSTSASTATSSTATASAVGPSASPRE